MKNIENYKTRFYTLMESTMGDVKPLISEAPQYEEYVEPEEEDFSIFANDKNNNNIVMFQRDNFNNLGYSNYEYRLKAKPGSYEAGEIITLEVRVKNDHLKVSDPLKYSGDAIRGKIIKYQSPCTIILKFKMPSTQKEYDSIKPFSKYAEVKFDNVRGGKIKFTILFPDVTINE